MTWAHHLVAKYLSSSRPSPMCNRHFPQTGISHISVSTFPAAGSRTFRGEMIPQLSEPCQAVQRWTSAWSLASCSTGVLERIWLLLEEPKKSQRKVLGNTQE